MKQITQLENALTSLKEVERLINEDCEDNCEATINQAIALGIISAVLCGQPWKTGREIKGAHNG